MKFQLYKQVVLTRDIPEDGFRKGDVATFVDCHRHPEPGGEARAPLEVRRSCLRRVQARRARLIRLV